jgi:sugar O-acyltransferase (sialic acid O-acetyltransferase NeuD family)
VTEKQELIIVGAGGLGREVFGYAQDLFTLTNAGLVLGFADDNPAALAGFDLGVGVLGPLDHLDADADTRFVVAVGDPTVRRRLSRRVYALGGRLATVVHPTAYVAAGTHLDDGCVVGPFAFIGAGARVGPNTVLNTYASIGHDTVVGDSCVFSPYAVVNGQAVIGDEVFLGTHATVTPRRKVGTGAKISTGAVVHRDVPAGALAVGDPARMRVLFPSTVDTGC